MRIEEWINYDTQIQQEIEKTYQTEEGRVRLKQLFGYDDKVDEYGKTTRSFLGKAFNAMKNPLMKVLYDFLLEDDKDMSLLTVIKSPSKHIHLYNKTILLNQELNGEGYEKYINFINDVNSMFLYPIINIFNTDPMIKIVIANCIVLPKHSSVIIVWKEDNKFKFGFYETVWSDPDNSVYNKHVSMNQLSVYGYRNIIDYMYLYESINKIQLAIKNNDESQIQIGLESYLKDVIKGTLYNLPRIDNIDIGFQVEFVNLSANCPIFKSHRTEKYLRRCPQYYYDTLYCYIYTFQFVVYFMDLFIKEEEFIQDESPEESPLLQTPENPNKVPVVGDECSGWFCKPNPRKNTNIKYKAGGLDSANQEISSETIYDLTKEAINYSLHTNQLKNIGKIDTLETFVYNAITLINANILLIVYYERMIKIRPYTEQSRLQQELINLKCGFKIIMSILFNDKDVLKSRFNITNELRCFKQNLTAFTEYQDWEDIYKKMFGKPFV